ncbi:hypothetical protein [Paenibacillus daejeonensis]|uniref:hypothetical protein n=1 Tax=Paenibacillus daejeonensis TaxID=135193 RepID=UPI000368F609|nr:hypothetical protein [Paenibacillus daejeonensis]
MRKKWIFALITLIVILIATYVYLDREIIALKTGRQLPIVWQYPYSDEIPIQLTEGNQTLSNPDVNLTPFYYLPETKQVHFGLWYKKWKYRGEDIAFAVFQISLEKENGDITTQDAFAKMPRGVLDVFHYRHIPIDLANEDSIKMTISLIEQQGRDRVPIETATMTIPIQLVESE